MLYIRADMNEVIATGHVMRCLSIADAAKTLGEETTFILADEQAVELIKEREHHYIVLHTKWDDMESELPKMKQIIAQNNVKKLLIDSYQVTKDYLMELTNYVKTIYLDDLDAFLYPVNEIICYANYWEKFQYEERYTDVKFYLGTQYMPLRQAFWKCPSKVINERVENLLILSGGSDPYDVTGRILAQIPLAYYREIHVICGAYNTRYESLCEQYVEHKNVYIHRAVSNIDCYMKETDVAISAGGTTLYELCACGTPTISYSFVDNQLDNVRKFAEDDMIFYAGDAREGDVAEAICNYLDRYGNDRKLRQERSKRMRRLVDGKGALRLAEAIRRN